MWLKLTNLVALLLATVWLSRSPDWEPAGAFAAALLTLLGQEWNENRTRRGPTGDQLDHDRALFAKYDAILTEAKLIDELNGDLFHNYTSTDFTRRLDEWLRLADTEEGAFMIASVQASFEQFINGLRLLRRFLSLHFFCPVGEQLVSTDEPLRLALYPEFRHITGDHGGPDYERFAKELLALCDRVEGDFKSFRKSVKLAIAR